MEKKEFHIEFHDYEVIPQVYVGSSVNAREGMFARRVKIPYGYHKLVFRDNKWIEI